MVKVEVKLEVKVHGKRLEGVDLKRIFLLKLISGGD